MRHLRDEGGKVLAGGSASRPLLKLAAGLSAQVGDARFGFQCARRALELCDEETWPDVLKALRDLNQRVPDSEPLDAWAQELQTRISAERIYTFDRPVSPTYVQREAAVLERLIEDRWRNRRAVPASLRLRHVVANAYEAAGQPWESIRIYEQLIAGLKTRLSPESDPMSEVRAGLARAEAAEDALGIPRPLSRAETLLGIRHKDDLPAPSERTRTPNSAAHTDGRPSIGTLVELAAQSAPFAQQREALLALLLARGVTRSTVNIVKEHVKEGVVLKRSDAARSRLGGPGLLPPDAMWPSNPNGYPMTLIAAIDLAELPHVAPLPQEGTLLLYWDSVDPTPENPLEAGRVFWIPASTEAMEVPAPPGLTTEFASIRVRGQRTAIVGEPVTVSSRVQHDRERYLLINEMSEISRQLYGHQLLGAPRAVQAPVVDDLAFRLGRGPAQVPSAFDEAELAATDWVLLAQIEEEPTMAFADGGALYFLLPEQDLAVRRFDRVAVLLQSH